MVGSSGTKARGSFRSLQGSALMLASATMGIVGCGAGHEEPAIPISTKTGASVVDGLTGRFDNHFNNSPGLSSRGPFTLDVFTSAAGGVYHLSADNGGWAPTWKLLPTLVAPRTFVGATVSASWSSTRIDVITTDDLGHVIHNAANNGVWSPTWDTVANEPDCVNGVCRLALTSWGVNRLDVFVFHGNPSLSHPQLDQITYDGTWHAPRQPIPGYPYGGPAVVSWGPSRIDLVGLGNDNETVPRLAAFHYFSNDGVTFLGPEPLGAPDALPAAIDLGPIALALTSWGPNVLDVLIPGQGFPPPDFVIQKSYRPTTGWGAWSTSLLGAPLPPNSQEFFFNASAASWGPGRIDMVSRVNVGSLPKQYMVGHQWHNESPPIGWFGTEMLGSVTPPASCLVNWQSNTTCAPLCTSRTQTDQAACTRVLNCYRDNNCGPGTCDASGQVCGPNVFGVGNAPYPFAQQVYNCIPGCPH